MLRYIYYKKFPKNFLIFIPILLNFNYLNIENILKTTFSFFIFCLVVNIIYLTNDYCDRNTDKNNILKKNTNIISLKTLAILNIFLFLIVMIFYNFFFINNWLILYLIFFYIYNFFLKKIIFIDIILLQSFYIFRLLYSAEIIELELTLIFILFFFCIFGTLAIIKRLIQINVNKLETKNNLIPYDINNVKQLTFYSYFYFFIASIILFIFLNNNIFFEFKVIENLFYLNFSGNFLLSNFIFIIFFLGFLRLFKHLKKKKIEKDIFEYISRDIIFILLAIITLFLIIFNLK